MALDIIILCGGEGSRIRPILGDLPKILAPINDHAFLEYIVAWLRSSLPAIPLSFYLSTGIGHDQIKDYVRSSCLDCILSREEQPLGTFGAVIDVVNRNRLSGNILVVNGDTIFDADFASAYDAFVNNFLHPLLLVKRASLPSRHGGYLISDSHLKFTNHNAEFFSLGAFFCTSSLIRQFSQSLSLGFPYLMLDRDFLDKALTLPYVLPSQAQFIDIGIPSDYFQAQTLVPLLSKL